MTLTPGQVNLIRNYVDQNRISIETLRDDLLDHLCCCVEQKLGERKTFEDALRESVHELAPDGFERLEYETFLLLNTTNTSMKTWMYLIGLLAAVSMSIGTAFQTLHWKGGFELFNYGFLTFGLLFLPMAAYNSYRLRIRRSFVEKLRIMLGFASGTIVAGAVLLKIIHYPGGDSLLLIGATIFSFGFLPCLFYSMYRKSMQANYPNLALVLYTTLECFQDFLLDY